MRRRQERGARDLLGWSKHHVIFLSQKQLSVIAQEGTDRRECYSLRHLSQSFSHCHAQPNASILLWHTVGNQQSIKHENLWRMRMLLDLAYAIANWQGSSLEG